MSAFGAFTLLTSLLAIARAVPAPQDGGSLGTVIASATESDIIPIITDVPKTPETPNDLTEIILIANPDGSQCRGTPEECGNPPPVTDPNQVVSNIVRTDGTICTGIVAECVPICALDLTDRLTWYSGGGEINLMAWFQENGTGKLQSLL
jgi:hypothetical protein